MNPTGIEFGLNSFGENASDDAGRRLSDAESVRVLVEEAELADRVGIDIFSIGEHYRDGYNDSAPHVILATIAGRTQRIRLGTSVTVLSTQDPVRLFTEYATLDATSNGRAQLIVGRASATESFPLFGFDLADYETLFEEKLDLFTRLLTGEPVTWSGTTRSPLHGQTLHPGITPGAIPTWVGVGGTPNSVVRAARFGLPMMLAAVGGPPARFSGHVDLYQRSLDEFGHARQPVGTHSLGLVADTDGEARELWWPYWERLMEQASIERGFPRPTRGRYEAEVAGGALYIGSPDTVAAKIAQSIRDLSLSRFDLKYDIVKLPAAARSRTIELLGTEVIPRVRRLLGLPDDPAQQDPHAGQLPRSASEARSDQQTASGVQHA